MSTAMLRRCPASAPCHQRRSRSSKLTRGMRWTTVAIAIVALFLTLNGARWLLQESPAAANELLVATCILDSVTGDESPLALCAETRRNEY